MNIRKLTKILKLTFNSWLDDKAPRLGAALAFYSALSIGPLLILALACAGLVFGREVAQAGILDQIGNIAGRDAETAIRDILGAAASQKESGIIATMFSLAALLFGASGVFGELQDALNTIWHVKPREGSGFISLLRERFFSLTMVLGTAFLLLISLVISAALSLITAYDDTMPAWYLLTLGTANFAVSLGVTTLLFATIFKVVPDAPVAWKDVWYGAALTALLFVVGKQAIGWYLGKSALASSYGAAGSIIVLLVWVYYSAQILFFGAEFTKVYARERKRSKLRLVSPAG